MRQSSDQRGANGDLLNGFDYDLQVWVRDGRVQRCGHPDTMACGCNGRAYAGLTIAEAAGLATASRINRVRG